MEQPSLGSGTKAILDSLSAGCRGWNRSNHGEAFLAHTKEWTGFDFRGFGLEVRAFREMR